MKIFKGSQGFSLMELLMVVAIIGVALAVIIPRAMRTSVEAKYQLARQNCAELARWGNEWAQRELEIQDTAATTTLSDYLETLGDEGSVDWIASPANTGNWQGTAEDVSIGTTPGSTVLDIMPNDNPLRNPFNGSSVFNASNLPAATAITGAIGCAWETETETIDGVDEDFTYLALIFQGTDSTTVTATAGTSFYAGQSPATLAGLRNGVFMARVRQ